MKKFILSALLALSLTGAELVVKPSALSVDDTIKKIRMIIEKKGLTLFAVIDHQKNASNAGMHLAPSKVIIFGNPKVGTKLMEENGQTALDLPIRVLVYQSEEGVMIAYRTGAWLGQTHHLENRGLLDTMDNALDTITTKASK